jgi:hypothetical protein
MDPSITIPDRGQCLGSNPLGLPDSDPHLDLDLDPDTDLDLDTDPNPDPAPNPNPFFSGFQDKRGKIQIFPYFFAYKLL